MASVLHLYVSVKSECLDHAIVQVDFCQILTMEAWVLSRASTYDVVDKLQCKQVFVQALWPSCVNSYVINPSTPL